MCGKAFIRYLAGSTWSYVGFRETSNCTKVNDQRGESFGITFRNRFLLFGQNAVIDLRRPLVHRVLEPCSSDLVRRFS